MSTGFFMCHFTASISPVHIFGQNKQRKVCNVTTFWNATPPACLSRLPVSLSFNVHPLASPKAPQGRNHLLTGCLYSTRLPQGQPWKPSVSISQPWTKGIEAQDGRVTLHHSILKSQSFLKCCSKRAFFFFKQASFVQIGEMGPRKAEDKILLTHLPHFVHSLLIRNAGWHGQVFSIECLWQRFTYEGNWFILSGELVWGNLSGTSWSLTYFCIHLFRNILMVEI